MRCGRLFVPSSIPPLDSVNYVNASSCASPL
nr:MAG TPA: Threonine synthase N terminus [Caudoviricetes sp.]